MDTGILAEHRVQIVKDLRGLEKACSKAAERLIQAQDLYDRAGAQNPDLKKIVEGAQAVLNNLDQARKNLDDALAGINTILTVLSH